MTALNESGHGVESHMNEIGSSPEEALAYVQRVPPRQGRSMLGVPFEPRDLVRVGFIGVGGR
ncbi:MAG: hypothetical protein FJ278_05675, partial [Planctomycetes bacterium]|nr:hypothetical protein [Planctomycetota bacterium]